MKKKLVMALVTGLTVFALAGCGEKAPTLEELKDNLSDKEPTSFELEANVSLKAEGEIVDPSDDFVEMMDMVEEYYDVDLSEPLDIDLSVSLKGSGEKNEEASHIVLEGEVKAKSSVDAIQDIIDESLEDYEDSASFENYIDYEEEVKYTLQDDEWYFDDYEEDDEVEDLDVMSSFIDYCIAHNESAEKDDQIEIKTVDGEYVISYEIEINNEFAENVSKDEKKALQTLLDDCEIEVDLDDLFDVFDEYGEYVDMSIPFSLELGFTNVGDKKEKEYALSKVDFSFGGKVSADWDEDVVAELFETAGEPMPEGIEFGAEFEIEATISGSATVKYDEELEVEIPSKVTKNAVSFDEYFGWATSDDDYEEYEYEVAEDDYAVAAEDDGIEPNADGSYTLVNYSNEKLMTFDLPDGWEVNSYSSPQYITLDNVDDGWTDININTYLESGIEAYYDDEASDFAKEEMVNFELVGKAGDFDVYVSEEYNSFYAVYYIGEYSGVQIKLYDSEYDCFESVDDFMDFVADNFEM